MRCLPPLALSLGFYLLMINSVYAHSDNTVIKSHSVLTLNKAISLAIHNDPWQQRSQFQENATLAKGIAMSSLPDPVVSIGLANLPTDGFAFDQEPMTQIKAGVSQIFPRGDTLKIQRQRQLELSRQQPFLRQDRKASVAVTAAHLWLDAFLAKASIQLIENDRGLFEQLGEIARSNYASALSNTRQQDLLQAELELTRIENRLLVLSTQQSQAMAKLTQWTAFAPTLNSDALRPSSKHDWLGAQHPPTDLPEDLPTIEPHSLAMFLVRSDEHSADGDVVSLDILIEAIENDNQQQLVEHLSMHPLIQSIMQKIAAGQSAIQLAKQQYKPQWGVNASYAYRDDDPLGRSRADFLSIGVSFDLPLFTKNRQDETLASAVSDAEAIKTEKRLALREMISGIRAVYVQYQRLSERLDLYRTRLLLQTQEQSEATLSGYTNDKGDFTEVVRARINLLNAQLDALSIEVDLLKTKIQMGYFLIQAKPNAAAHMADYLADKTSFAQSSGRGQ